MQASDQTTSPTHVSQREQHTRQPAQGHNLPSLLTLPEDILILVVFFLCFDPEQLYAPLICSRVCSHWRKVILNTPSLWSFINTLRRRRLTELWLVNSRNAWLDVRLCDKPPPPGAYSHKHLSSAGCPTPLIVNDIKAHIHRWRSLDISYSRLCHTISVLMDLCELREPLCLESFTIGPMGKTNLDVNGTPILSTAPPVGDPSVARGVFQGIQVQPVALRVDTFPVCPSPVFSTRLATFHFFGGEYLAEYPNPAEWYTILSAAPNLVELRLWHPRHGDTTSLPCRNSVNLPLLKRLDLAGLFVQLCGLFTQYPLPNLMSLLLDSLDPHTNIPQQVTSVALVSPQLEHLSIGSMVSNSRSASGRWARPLQALRSLQTITFIEAEWEEISTALKQLGLTPGEAVHVRLERIHDIVLEELERLEVEGNKICSTELVDCVEGARCRSVDRVERGRCRPVHHGSNFSGSEQGSNYSDGSSISYIYEVTSEESGPEEYEYSSAEDWYSSESESGDDKN